MRLFTCILDWFIGKFTFPFWIYQKETGEDLDLGETSTSFYFCLPFLDRLPHWPFHLGSFTLTDYTCHRYAEENF